MVLLSRSRFFRGLLALLFIGATLCVGWVAVSLLIEVVTGHGSPEGKILSTALGLSLLTLSSVFLFVGIINWRRLSQLSTKDASA
jgi:hypothetical protein